MTTSALKSKQLDVLNAFLAVFNYDQVGVASMFNQIGVKLSAAKNEDPTNVDLQNAIAAVNGVANALNIAGPKLRAALNGVINSPPVDPYPIVVAPDSSEIRMLNDQEPSYSVAPFFLNVGDAKNVMLATLGADHGLRMIDIFSITWSITSDAGVVQLEPSAGLLAFGCTVKALVPGAAVLKAEVKLNEYDPAKTPIVFSTTADITVQ